MKKLIIFSYLFFLLASVWAQAPKTFEPRKEDFIWHQNLITGASLQVAAAELDVNNAPVSVQWMTGSAIDFSKQHLQSSTGLISLEVDHQHYENAGTSFDYTFGLKVTSFNFNLNKSVDSVVFLSINNFPIAKGDKSISRATKVYTDVVYMEVEVLSVYDNLSSSAISNPKNNLSLKGSIDLERHFDFDEDNSCGAGDWQVSYQSSTNSFVVEQPNSIDCEEVLYATEWDIEWTYADNYSTNPLTGYRRSVVDVSFDFEKNATRVRLPIATQSYKVQNIFEEGYVFFRIRLVGRKGDDFGQYYEGVWYPENPRDIAFNHDLKVLIENSAVPSHEEGDKTWQYVASYAENGKNKEVVSYYDGLNKNRQAVTKLSTEGTIVAGETVYDREGRPAVQILPVPVNDNGILEYQNGINESAVGGDPYSANDFDGKATPNPLDSTVDGAAKYYSGSNNLDGMHKDYIPKGSKYPFTQTVFTADGTGRVRKQSGVGDAHRIGSGNEIEYLYAKPTQAMLDQLFGTEVGEVVHYKENTVIDANGQISVSYIDQHGRVIMTSLGGDAPANLDPLDTQIPVLNATYLTESIGDSNNTLTSQPRPYAYELHYPYVAKGKADHTFWYEFQPEKYLISCNDICLDCAYDLSILIENEAGDSLFDTLVNIRPLNSYDVSCEPSSVLKLWPGTDINNSTFSLNLPVGKYHVHKRLEINKYAENEHWEAYFASDSACFIPFNDFVDSALNYVVDCDSVWILEDSNAHVPAFIRNLEFTLLRDIYPGEQYGAYYDSINDLYFGPEGAISKDTFEIKYKGISVYSQENILETVFDGNKASWDDVTDAYEDESGQLDFIYDPAVETEVLPNSVAHVITFINEFKPRWARQLLHLHPEYAFYHIAKSYEESFVFNEKLLATKTYADAVDSGYISSSNEYAILDKDPLYQSALDSMVEQISGLLTPNAIIHLQLKNKLSAYIDTTAYYIVDNPTPQTAVASLKKLAATVTCEAEGYKECKRMAEFGLSSEKKYLDQEWANYRNIYLGRKSILRDDLFRKKATLLSNKLTFYLLDTNLVDAVAFANYYSLDSTKDHTALLRNKKKRYVTDRIAKEAIPDTTQAWRTYWQQKNVYVNDKIEEHCAEQCSSYVERWREQLLMCDATASQVNIIIAGFLSVCKTGCWAEEPFGVSELESGKTTNDPAQYTSFKHVLETVLGAQKAGNNYCNFLLIDDPKPQGHSVRPSVQLKNAEVDVSCGCEVLRKEVEDFKTITMEEDSCKKWIEPVTTYIDQGKRLMAFLNELDGENKITATRNDFLLAPSTFPLFHSYIKPWIKDTLATYWCFTEQSQPTASIPKLIIHFYKDGKPSELFNIEIYGFPDSFSIAHNHNYSTYKPNQIFLVGGEARKGFSLAINRKGIYPYKHLFAKTFGFALPPNRTVTTKRTCALGGSTKSMEEVREDFLDYSDLDLTQAELTALEIACDRLQKIINDSLAIPRPKEQFDPASLSGDWFSPEIEEIEFDMTVWLNQMAGQDIDGSGNVYTGKYSEDFSMNYKFRYHLAGEIYNYLPDSFSTFAALLEGYFHPHDNFKVEEEDSVSCNCSPDGDHPFRDKFPLDNYVWGGHIGSAKDGDSVEVTYVALALLGSAHRENFGATYKSAFGVNDIDSVRNYHYEYYLDRYLVDVYINTDGGYWTKLIFYNEYQEYACRERCETFTNELHVRDDVTYDISCRLNQCRLLAMESLLDTLAAEDSLTALFASSIVNHEGYKVGSNVATSLQYFGKRYLSTTVHTYRALYNPDLAGASKDTLRAAFGYGEPHPVQLTLVKNISNIDWSDLVTFYGIRLDSTTWIDNLLNGNTDFISPGYHFRIKATNDTGAVVLIHGYTNSFFFGTCIVNSDQELAKTQKEKAQALWPYMPETIRDLCPKCESCFEMDTTIKRFYTTYPELANNHVHHNQMLTNYLNTTFKNNLYAVDYLNFIEQCELSDSVAARRLVCNYSYEVDAARQSSAHYKLRKLSNDLFDSTGQYIVYQRDSLSSGGDYYCIDLSSIHRRHYLKVLDLLKNIADTAGYSNKEIDLLDANDLTIEFRNKPYTVACRNTLSDLMDGPNDFTALYPYITYDTLEVHEHEKKLLESAPVLYFYIDFGASSPQQISGAMARIKDSMTSCAGYELYGKYTQPYSYFEFEKDSICPDSLRGESAWCTDCESVRKALKGYTHKLDVGGGLVSNFENELERHLEDTLGRKLFVQQQFKGDCDVCDGLVTFVCEELSEEAEQLEDFLIYMGTSGLIRNDNYLLYTVPSFHNTILYPGTDNSVTYNGFIPTDPNFAKILIRDTNGFKLNIWLQGPSQSGFDFDLVSALKNLRIKPQYAGDNFYFAIDAKMTNGKWYEIEGHTSRYPITKCCRFKSLKLCHEPKFKEIVEEPIPCDSIRHGQARILAGTRYREYLKLQERIFKEAYHEACAQAFESEKFEMKYPQLQNHFTLYYYDLAGNLVRTVPPEGVELNTTVNHTTTQGWRELGWTTARDEYNVGPQQYRLSNHKLSTYYQYNSLNEVTRQNTPDGGTSEFHYDRLGRLVFSQNAEQASRDNVYSYTKYDGLGRIREVGEMALPYAVHTDSLRSDTGYFNSRYQQGVLSQITCTQYDNILNTAANAAFGQHGQTYLRNRVAAVYYKESKNVDYAYATHYGYDAHGNVKTLLNEYPELAQFGHRFKRIDYEYDLVSGNVNRVNFQKGEADQFFHKYSYDADNRITDVYTSGDGYVWERDANYEYYLHGPLARTVLGEDHVQGIDYAYTLHGWLKGVNSATLNKTRDIGKDGDENYQVAQDAFGFTLGYYQNDYNSVETTNFLATTGTSNLGGSGEGIDLYNGNIGYMTTANRAMFEANKGVLGMNYKYDQLNRIKSSEAYEMPHTATNSWASLNPSDKYSTDYTYDANGNLMSLKRYGHVEDTLMDNLLYHYQPASNKLDYVNDQADEFDDRFNSDLGGVEDINSGQEAGNYQYDPIGNLITDRQEGIRNIDWSVYGKVRKVERADTSFLPDLEFKYDASGNRVVKVVRPTPIPYNWTYTYYVRDAQGNVMATYNLQNGMLDSSFSDRYITEYVVDVKGIEQLASMLDEYNGADPTFVAGLLTVLEDLDYDTLVMKEYLFDSVICWSPPLTIDLLEAYGNNTTNFEDIIDSLVQRHPTEMAQALVGPGETKVLEGVLAEDSNEDLLDCFDAGDVFNIHAAIFMGTPPVPAAKGDAISDLMDPTQRTALAAVLTTSYNSKTESYLDTCVSKSLFVAGIKTGLANTNDRKDGLDNIGNRIGSADLKTFFTTAGDSDGNRPFQLLRTHGTHSVILNTLADHDPDSFVVKGLHQDEEVIDQLLIELTEHTTAIYIDQVYRYFGEDFVNTMLLTLKASLIFKQQLKVTEHNIYGSSRLGTKTDTNSLYHTHFRVTGIDTTTGTFTKGSVYFEDSAQLDSVQLSRPLGWKTYELSNHLGNVLATVSDKRLYLNDTTISGSTHALWDAHVKSAQDYYPFGMMMPNRLYTDTALTEKVVHIFTTYDTTVQQYNFDSTLTSDWTARSGSSVALDNDRLKITTPNQNGYATCTLNTVAGKKYRLSANVIYGTSDSVNFNGKALPGLAQLLNENYISGGKASFEFTATTSEVRFRIKRQDHNNQGTLSFYIDNFTLSEIRDTFYTDTITVATGDGYRYAFNGKEVDNEWNGVGNMYDYGFRIYDPRISKFLSVDPLFKSYPWYTPYQFAGNMPIMASDLDGLEYDIVITGKFWRETIQSYVDAGDIESANRLLRTALMTGTLNLNSDEGREWAKNGGTWEGNAPTYSMTNDEDFITYVYFKDPSTGALIKIPELTNEATFFEKSSQLVRETLKKWYDKAKGDEIYSDGPPSNMLLNPDFMERFLLKNMDEGELVELYEALDDTHGEGEDYSYSVPEEMKRYVGDYIEEAYGMTPTEFLENHRPEEVIIHDENSDQGKGDSSTTYHRSTDGTQTRIVTHTKNGEKTKVNRYKKDIGAHDSTEVKVKNP